MKTIYCLLVFVILISGCASPKLGEPWTQAPDPDRSYIGPPPPGNRRGPLVRARIHVRAEKDSVALQEFRFFERLEVFKRDRFRMVTLEADECTDTSAAFVAYWSEDPDWDSLPPEILGIEYPTTIRRRTVKEYPGGPPLDYPVEKHRGEEYVRSYVTVEKRASTKWFKEIGFIRYWQPEELQSESEDLYDGLLPLELEWTKLPSQIMKVEFPETRMGRFNIPCNYELGLNCIDTTGMKGIPVVQYTMWNDRSEDWPAWVFIDSIGGDFGPIKLRILSGEAMAHFHDDPRVVCEALFPLDYDWSTLPAEIYHIEFIENTTPDYGTSGNLRPVPVGKPTIIEK